MHPLNYIKNLDLGKKTVLIWDHGLFEHFGSRLAEDYKEVLYFTPWVTAFNHPMDKMLGKGVPGLTRVDSFDDNISRADLICFPDAGMGDKQVELRRAYPGKRVWGCGAADILEQDRFFFAKTLRDRGLPVVPFVKIKGIDALVAHLKAHKDKWIQVNNDSRGVCETWHHEDYRTSMTYLDKIAYDLGPLRETQLFKVNDPVPGVEPGSDLTFGNKKYLETGIYGWERKGVAYAGKFLAMDKFPAPMKRIHDAMAPVFARYDVRGAMSTEVRGEKEWYFTDPCMRMGCPPSAISVEGYTNFSAIAWEVAGGNDIKPEPRAKYTAEVIIHSRACDDTLGLALDIKEKDLKMVKCRYLTRINNQFFRINVKNGGSNVAEAIGFGDSLEEAQEQAMESADKLNCNGKEVDHEAFEALAEDIEKGSRLGLGRF